MLSGAPVPPLPDVYLREVRGHIHTETRSGLTAAMFPRAPKERTSLPTSKGSNRGTNHGQLVGGLTVGQLQGYAFITTFAGAEAARPAGTALAQNLGMSLIHL